MFDKEKIDSYFNWDSQLPAARRNSESTSRHTRFVRLAKLLLPSIAAVLIGLLLVFPSLKKDTRDFKLDITRPKQGELEKLHVENTVFTLRTRTTRSTIFWLKILTRRLPVLKS